MGHGFLFLASPLLLSSPLLLLFICCCFHVTGQEVFLEQVLGGTHRGAEGTAKGSALLTGVPGLGVLQQLFLAGEHAWAERAAHC